MKRFWNKVRKTKTCWVWTAGKYWDGYGKFRASGKSQRTHRFSYEIKNGKIPFGMCVLHKCDNRACVNPKHLFIGTKKDNCFDMFKKGRSGLVGEKHPISKLTRPDIIKIRKYYSQGKVTQRYMAEYFGVSYQLISKIVNFKAWKHI